MVSISHLQAAVSRFTEPFSQQGFPSALLQQTNDIQSTAASLFVYVADRCPRGGKEELWLRAQPVRRLGITPPPPPEYSDVRS